MISIKHSYLGGVVLALLAPFAHADNTLDANSVAPGISTEVLRAGLADNLTAYLGTLLANPKERAEFLRNYYAFQGLEQRAKQLTLAEQEQVRVEAVMRRNEILREAVIKHELEARQLDMEALAKERYEAKKESYQTQRRIKIAQIFMAKKPGQEAEVKTRMEAILKQLEEDNLRRHQEQEANKAATAVQAADSSQPEGKDAASKDAASKDNEKVDLFAELAKQHSEDANAALGGFDSRWLLQPMGVELKDPVVKAAFDLLVRGEMTGVIDGKHGYHILRLMDYVPNRQQTFDEVKGDLITAIKNELWSDKDKALTLELQAPKAMPLNDDLALKIIGEAYAARDGSLKPPAPAQPAE